VARSDGAVLRKWERVRRKWWLFALIALGLYLLGPYVVWASEGGGCTVAARGQPGYERYVGNARLARPQYARAAECLASDPSATWSDRFDPAVIGVYTHRPSLRIIGWEYDRGVVGFGICGVDTFTCSP
jgi:hypothetical protein